MTSTATIAAAPSSSSGPGPGSGPSLLSNTPDFLELFVSKGRGGGGVSIHTAIYTQPYP